MKNSKIPFNAQGKFWCECTYCENQRINVPYEVCHKCRSGHMEPLDLGGYDNEDLDDFSTEEI